MENKKYCSMNEVDDSGFIGKAGILMGVMGGVLIASFTEAAEYGWRRVFKGENHEDAEKKSSETTEKIVVFCAEVGEQALPEIINGVVDELTSKTGGCKRKY